MFGPTFSDYYANETRETRSSFDLISDSSLKREYDLIKQKKSLLPANRRKKVILVYEKRMKEAQNAKER